MTTYEGHAPEVKRRVFKTPTREFSERWDAANGWVPAGVVRDDRTLAGRWGLPAAARPYCVTAFLLGAGGAAVLLIPILSANRRRAAMRGRTGGEEHTR